MKIQITRQDIQQAKRNGVDNPVTLALHRVLGGEWYVLDGDRREVAVYKLSPPHRSIVLPRCVVTLLRAWKNSECIEPFEFELAAEITVPVQQQSTTSLSFMGN